MIRAFGLLIAICFWGLQVQRWLSTGAWPPMPFFPLVDQWLPSVFVYWLIEQHTWEQVASFVSMLLHANAGVIFLVACWLLQMVVPTKD